MPAETPPAAFQLPASSSSRGLTKGQVLISLMPR